MIAGDLGHDPSQGRSSAVWPPFIDLVTAALMVFVLVGFVDSVLRPEALEAALLRAAQDRFLDALRQEFAAELDRGAIAVERNLDYVQVTFTDGILFTSGDHHLQAGGRRILARCAGVVQRGGASGIEQVQVEGHTDSLPLNRSSYPADNWELSTARAIRVVQFLIAQGLPPAVFSANGYADQRPVASNARAAGRASNRRIELRVFFSADSAPPAGPPESP